MRFFGGRSQGKTYAKAVTYMLDEPLFHCERCRILFPTPKYLAQIQVMYCPQCAERLGSPRSLRQRYLDKEE